MPTANPILRKKTQLDNLSRNPSLEAAVGSWAQYGLGAGITATAGGFERVSGAAFVGSWCWRINVLTNSAPANGYVCQVEDGYWDSDHIPGIVAGRTYTASGMYMSASPDFGYRIALRWYNGAGTFLSEVGSSVNPSYSLSNQYKQRSVTATAPATATNCTVIHIVYSKTAGTLGEVRIDGFMVHEGEPTGYFDGSFTNCLWLGTAHLSASRRLAYEIRRYLTKRGLVLMEPIVKLSDNTNKPGNDITDYFISGSVEMDYDKEIKTTARITLTDPDIIDEYSDRFAVYMRLSYPDGSQETHQIGLFLAEPPKKTIRFSQSAAEYDCFDMTYNLQQMIPGKTIEFGGGVNVMNTLRDKLTALGFPRNEIPHDTEVFPARGWRRPPSTDMNWLRILSDMAAVAGHYRLWATRTGRIKTLAYTSRKIRSSVKTYVGGEDGVVIEPFTTNLLTKPINRVVVQREVDGTTYTGEARNDNPADPHSIPRIGEKTEYVTDDKVASNTKAQALAEEILDSRGGLDLQAEMTTLPEPWHDVHEVYTLALLNHTGVAIPDATGRYWCKSFSMGLTASEGLMTHRMQRVVQLEDI